MHPLIVLSTTAVITLVIDFVWLGFIANKLYLKEIGSLIRKNSSGGMDPLWIPAFFVYLVIPLLIYFFALPKGMGKGPLEAFFWGATLGGLTYAVYDLTNLATLKGWSPTVTVIDILWGAFLCGVVTLIVTRIFSV